MTLAAGLVGAALAIAIHQNRGPAGSEPALILIPVLLLSFYFGPLVGGVAALGGAASVGVIPDITLFESSPSARDAWVVNIGAYVGVSVLIGVLSAHTRHVMSVRLREEQRARQEALRRLQSAPDLMQQERLRALSQLASGVVHDISNTLVPIAAFTELILEAPDLLEDRVRILDYVRTMNMAADDARRILLRLRTLYRPYEERPVSGPVDLNRLAQEVLSLTEPRWKAEARARGVAIEAKMDLQVTQRASCSDADLREVLMNLIFNAVDAMPDGGSLRLSTHLKEPMCCLTVEDTGTGMSPDVLRNAMEPFFTTKGEKGTGMGLSIAAGIVEAHGGWLEIDSRPGEGTRVNILLPVYTENEGAEHVEHVASALNRPLRVLVVDDSPSSLHVLNEYLALDHHVVETATDGEEGLQKARSGRFDVAIVDAALPKLSGLQMAEAVSREVPTCKIIVLTSLFTGLTQPENMQRVEGTPYLLLNKPCTHAELRRALAASIPSQGPGRP